MTTAIRPATVFPPLGTTADVTYFPPRGETLGLQRVTGRVVADTYHPGCLVLSVGSVTLAIRPEEIRVLNGRLWLRGDPVGAGCGQCDRCKMNADVPAGRGWSDCGRSGKPAYVPVVSDYDVRLLESDHCTYTLRTASGSNYTVVARNGNVTVIHDDDGWVRQGSHVKIVDERLVLCAVGRIRPVVETTHIVSFYVMSN